MMFKHTTSKFRVVKFFRVASVTAALVAIAILRWGGANVQADAYEGTFVCFPTCSTVDGRMLGMTGTGVSSLAGSEVLVGINSAPSAASLIVGFFDGETGGGSWDNPNASPLLYELYADPLGDGSGIAPANLVQTWFGAAMANNAWSDMPAVPNSPLAQNATGSPFRYVLRVSQLNLAATGSTNFKVRTNGTIGVRPGSFGFQAPFTTAGDRLTYYPAYPTLTPTTYDGRWSFSFSVPNPGLQRLTLWDGDMDFGDAGCEANDTDDLDSPAFPTLFAINGFALPEGVAGGGSST